MNGVRKAVILCAGYGTRLRPLTERCPKVMLSVGGRPLLEQHLQWLKAHGVSEFYINLHHLPDVITNHLGDGTRWGVRVVYSFEETLLGTAGALRAFRDHLDETFLVHYGDVYSQLDVVGMVSFHRWRAAAATLVVHPTDRPWDSDVVELNEDCRVTSVHQRPGTMRYGNLGNAACYLLNPRVLDYIPDNGAECDFIRNVFPAMIRAREPLFAYRSLELLQDIGTVERYEGLRKTLMTHEVDGQQASSPRQLRAS